MYVTNGGRILRRCDRLRSCGVSDGCTIQVTSRMRGGGGHKDKKNKAEKKQAVSHEALERKCDEEPESDRGPVIQKSKEEKKQVTSEEQVSDKGPASLKSLWRIEKDRAIQSIEEDERYRKIVEDVSEGSDVEVEQKTKDWMTKLEERPEYDRMCN